ncbi:MAG: PsiF family protein [Burkholderiales bacterium]
MRQPIVAVFAAALCASPALAQDKQGGAQKQATAQEKRTAVCTKQAADKGLKGRERSQSVSACLRAGQPKAK